tara:strand:- start:274 stop:834 length:561 start_codon:yes stop_codon:yes gene_type:complete
MSDIKVAEVKTDTIKNQAGTTAMTVNSNGNINLNKNLIEYWYFGGTDATLNSGDTLTNWTQDTRTNVVSRNAGMTDSSGIFSFPHDGLYKITALLLGYASPAARGYLGLRFEHSTNSGASYNIMTTQYTNAYTTNAHFSVTTVLPLNITASTDRFRILYIGQGSTTIRGYGSTADNSTRVLFEQIG